MVTYAAISAFVMVYIFGKVYPRQMVTVVAILAVVALLYPLLRNVDVTAVVQSCR